MSLNFKTTLTIDAPVSNGICLSQTPSAGGAQDLTLNGSLVSGGEAILDTNRRIQITSDADDSGRTFTVVGYNRYTEPNNPLTETIVGPDTGSVTSSYDYDIIISVSVDSDTAGAITVGTNQVASTQWVPFNVDLPAFYCSFFCCPSEGASLTYTVEHTPEDVQTSPNVDPLFIFPNDDPSLVNASTQKDGNYQFPVTACRLTLNTFSSGDITFFVKQTFKT